MVTPLQRTMTTIGEGTFDEFRRMLAEHPGLLDEHGPHMLAHAAENDRFDVMAFLVEAGVDVNAGFSVYTPLTVAARDGTVEAARWLLDHGADVNGRAEPTASTPLEEAVVEGRLEMVEYLLERGADPGILHGNPQRNALASARFWGQDEIAEFLEGRGLTEVVIERDPVDVESPEFLDKGKPLAVGEWFDQKWRHVYAYGVRHGLASMCERNQTLFLVGYLIDQLADGGTSFVYINPSAEYASEMAGALERIGASRAADVMRRINATFPGGSPAKDRDLRMDQLESLPPEASELGEELERIFDEWRPDGGERELVVQLYAFWHA
jgi:Ankyrin repeats (3 copies)/Domain of unknown function (DUF4375)